VQFLVNSRLADGAGRDQLIEYFGQHHIDSSTWDLVRHHVVADHMFKGSDEPGVILVRDVDTSGEAEEATKAPPVVEHVLLRFELDPVSAITHSPALAKPPISQLPDDPT
jgi:hypothetical protein